MNNHPALTELPSGVMELIDAVQRLSLARDVATIQDIVRRAARRLTGADGATFVLRDGDRCHYVDEDAIAPLWKGQRFPLEACISGWSMLHRQPVVIEDIYADERIPHDAYRKTFVRSLLMVPIRTLEPVGAVGNYWASHHRPTSTEVELLQALANATAVALENVRVFSELEARVRARTAELEAANRHLLAAQQQAHQVFAAYARALPGTVLDGKYRLDAELGSGGFGVVFRGRHLILDCPIAIKVFRPVAGNDSARSLQRFLREGAAAARLNHPNVVRILDSDVSSEGVAFLIMELLQGRSLADELTNAGWLSLRRCATIAAAVADALATAHQHGILHRDIKPENIFLHQSEGREIVKVVDFGIAGFLGQAAKAGADHLTCTGEFIGTPSYVAPERLHGDPDDGRSDVFSLGATMYEMICGTSPWTREQELKRALGFTGNCQPLPLHEFRKGVPAILETLVLQAMAWDPAQRPTAQQLAGLLTSMSDALDDAVDERPAPAQDDSSSILVGVEASGAKPELPDWWNLSRDT